MQSRDALQKIGQYPASQSGADQIETARHPEGRDDEEDERKDHQDEGDHARNPLPKKHFCQAILVL
jgi:hypothetical protein